MGKPLDRRRRAELKRRVRAEVDRLVGLGLVPSERKLKVAFPHHGGYLLLTLRDELADEGLVAWRAPYDEPDSTRGLSGATAAERDEIAARAAAIRAEHVAAARVTAGDASRRQATRVYRHPTLGRRWRS